MCPKVHLCRLFCQQKNIYIYVSAITHLQEIFLSLWMLPSLKDNIFFFNPYLQGETVTTEDKDLFLFDLPLPSDTLGSTSP